MNYFEPYDCQFNEKDRKQLIAQSLEALRKANGFSQKEVAQILGINPVTYNGYEKGKSEPSAELLVRLSYLFHVPTDIILQRETFVKNEKDIESQINEKLIQYKKQLAEYKEQASMKNNEKIMDMIDQVDKFVDVLNEIKEYAKNNK